MFEYKNKINLLNDGCNIIISGFDDLPNNIKVSYPQLKKSVDLFVGQCRTFNKLENELESLIKLNNTNEDVNILFTGRISTGKSKIINALLRRDILKSSVGHTTRSFIKISKSQEEDNSIYISKEYVKRFRTDNELKNYLGDNTSFQYNNDYLTNEVEILLPCRSNPILMDNVFIYDSPGFGKEDDSTLIIEEKCQIADILVFVITNNITMESMLIFDKLKRFAAVIPTIILINKWDETDRDDKDDFERMMEDIENEITKRIRSEKETNAKHCFFYISGKEEMLDLDVSLLNEKGLQRFQNFGQFIRTLQKLIESAPKDKYNRISINFEEIKNELKKTKKMFDSERNIIVEHLTALIKQFQDFHQRISDASDKIENFVIEIPNKIDKIKEEHRQTSNHQLFISELFQIYDPFDRMYNNCNDIMSKFTKFLPKKNMMTEVCCKNLESQKRRIEEQKTQSKTNLEKAVSTGGTAWNFLRNTLGLGTMYAATLGAVAGVGHLVWNYFKGSNDNEIVTENADKCKMDLINMYTDLKEAIKDSGLQNDWEISIEILQKLLANIVQNKKEVDEAFY